MRFQDKVVLVTGAGSGIGAGVAQAFARAGARVMLADINAEQGQQCLAAIEAEGGQAAFFQVDVTSAAQMRDLVTATVSRFGRLDIVHNNAGISGSYHFTAAIEEDEFDRVVAVNLKAVWLCMKYAIEQMLAQGGGVIVNTASADASFMHGSLVSVDGGWTAH